MLTYILNIPVCPHAVQPKEPGTVITLICKHRSVLFGHNVITCQDDGTWSEMNGKCIRVGKLIIIRDY